MHSGLVTAGKQLFTLIRISGTERIVRGGKTLVVFVIWIELAEKNLGLLSKPRGSRLLGCMSRAGQVVLFFLWFRAI